MDLSTRAEGYPKEIYLLALVIDYSKVAKPLTTPSWVPESQKAAAYPVCEMVARKQNSMR